MKPYQRLAEATAPDGTVLTLYRHDGAYLLRAGTIELMSTRRSFSEERLGTLACEPLATVRGAAVLIGGLGFGFTLKAALRTLAPDAEVVVAELLPEVIAWNENAEYALAGDALHDPRVTLEQDDVARILRRDRSAYDAILLDVDNGAEAFTTVGNGALYGDAGIGLAMAALRPEGVLAYWSATPEPAFEARLRQAGLIVHAERARAYGTGGPAHTIILGQLPK